MTNIDAERWALIDMIDELYDWSRGTDGAVYTWNNVDGRKRNVLYDRAAQL